MLSCEITLQELKKELFRPFLSPVGGPLRRRKGYFSARPTYFPFACHKLEESLKREAEAMQRRLFFWEAGGFLFVGALGVLLHFVYEWSGDSPWAAAFSAVNESTWEHIKLLYLPLFLFSVVQVCLLWRNYPHLPAVRALSALTGLALIPVLFYTYTGVLGRDFVWADVAIFFLADLGAFALDFALLRRGRCSAGWQQVLGLAALWGLAFCFVWCTFHPVRLPLWQDPVTGLYGIS